MKRFFRKKHSVEDLDPVKYDLPEYTNLEMERRIDDRIHSAKDRTLFKHKLIDGMSLADAAENAGLPLSTARDHYYRYLKILLEESPEL